MNHAPIGAFASSAMKYFHAGLAPTPTGGPDGKRPLLKAYPKRPLGPEAIAATSKRFPDANISLVTGLSRLAVIDIDDPSEDLLAKALDRFGHTPVIARTGRGGHHLFFRGYPSLRPHDFRQSDGVPQELKCDGNVVLVPPSRNLSTGGQYSFITGGIGDIASLPNIDTRSLPQLDIRARSQGRPLDETYRRVVALGERNSWLFGQCLRAAHHVDDIDALIDVARTRADEHFGEPMADGEIVKTARSAWGYQSRGMNWSGGPARFALSLDVLRRFEALGSDAVVLALHLRLEHGGRASRGETFALATAAMERADVVPGWAQWRYHSAVRTLLHAGVLDRAQQGVGRGNPSLYRIMLRSFEQ